MITLLKPRSVFIPCILLILKIHFYPSICECNPRIEESNIEFANFTNEYMKYVIAFIPEELRIMFCKKKIHFLLSSFINDYLFIEGSYIVDFYSVMLFFSVIVSKVISKVNFFNITCITDNEFFEIL